MDSYPERSNLREEAGLLAHSLKEHSMFWQGSVVAAGGSGMAGVWQLMAHIISGSKDFRLRTQAWTVNPQICSLITYSLH